MKTVYKWVIKDLVTGELFISEHWYADEADHARTSHGSFQAILRIDDTVKLIEGRYQVNLNDVRLCEFGTEYEANNYIQLCRLSNLLGKFEIKEQLC